MTALPRATCGQCGNSVPVRVGGELREHRGTDASTCPGSGRSSRDLRTEEAADRLRANGHSVDLGGKRSRVAMLALDALRVDPTIQQRDKMNQDQVWHYLDLMLDGVELPAVIAFEDPADPGEGCWLADGFHREDAARRAGRTEILTDLRKGTRRDALQFSLSANDTNGLHRTNADKRKAVTTALADPEWSQLSDREIARMCSVSNNFVSEMRRGRRPSVSSDDTPPTRPAVPAMPPEETPAEKNARLHAEAVAKYGEGPPSTPSPEFRMIEPPRCGALHPETGLPCREPPGHAHSHGYAGDGRRIGWPVEVDLDAARREHPLDPVLVHVHHVPSMPADVQARPRCDRSGRPVGTCDCDRCRPPRTQREVNETPAIGPEAEALLEEEPPDLEDAPTVLEDPPTVADEQLANDQRAPFDAYWTPSATARACVRWLCDTFGLPDDVEAVEPAVGGGSWVQAWREVRPLANVARFDIDAKAPGLEGARRTGGAGNGRGEMTVVGDWLDWEPGRYTKRSSWDVCAGNRPYDGPFDRWFEVSMARARIVAYLERETITGTETRLPWWLAHRPSYVVKVVPRPKWEGPGARTTSDFSDSVLIVWVRDWPPGPTQWDWIDVDGVVPR